MKKLLMAVFLIVLSFILTAHADEVTIGWDEMLDAEHYHVYSGIVSREYFIFVDRFEPKYVLNETQCNSIKNAIPPQTLYIGLKSVNSAGVESAFSSKEAKVYYVGDCLVVELCTVPVP